MAGRTAIRGYRSRIIAKTVMHEPRAGSTRTELAMHAIGG